MKFVCTGAGDTFAIFNCALFISGFQKIKKKTSVGEIKKTTKHWILNFPLCS